MLKLFAGNLRSNTKVVFPRRTTIRTTLRWLSRVLMRCFIQLEIKGAEHWPQSGRLLIVSNHSSYLEAALLATYSPQIIEALGADDVPLDPRFAWLMHLYAFIPINRGTFDRRGLAIARNCLEQEGWLALFPEGGIWDKRLRDAHIGVAWLSAKANAPILPIGFGGLDGALAKAVKLQRPKIVMTIGACIPPITLKNYKKEALQIQANQVMSVIQSLLPPDELLAQTSIYEETFSCCVSIQDSHGNTLQPNVLNNDTHQYALGHLIFVPVVLNTIRRNFKQPIDALQRYNVPIAIDEFFTACEVVLEFLETVSPAYLSFRFGPILGRQMHAALQGLSEALKTANGDTVVVSPLRTYRLIGNEHKIVETDPGAPHV